MIRTHRKAALPERELGNGVVVRLVRKRPGRASARHQWVCLDRAGVEVAAGHWTHRSGLTHEYRPRMDGLLIAKIEPAVHALVVIG